MLKKYPLTVHTYKSPPPRSAMMEGNAVDVMVASMDVSRLVKLSDITIIQSLSPCFESVMVGLVDTGSSFEIVIFVSLLTTCVLVGTRIDLSFVTAEALLQPWSWFGFWLLLFQHIHSSCLEQNFRNASSWTMMGWTGSLSDQGPLVWL